MTTQHASTDEARVAGGDRLPPDFDPDELRKRYAEERAKRLRPDGKKQYVYLDEVAYADRFVSDPWSLLVPTRDAVTETVEVCVIGAGLGGLQAAVLLRKAGIENFRIIDKAGGFGGVWYWNRYPGAQCDVDAYIYLPFLEEVETVPPSKYASSKVIREHCEAVADRFDLFPRSLFNTAVVGAVWDDDAQSWVVSTDRGDTVSARFLIMCPGGLQQPKLPGVPGIENFKGHAFHASRWDYSFTGGAEGQKMDGLADKRIALIGTGATAIQCVPQLAEAAEHLYVFQRTPNAVSARDQKPTDPDWYRSQPPGWQLDRQLNFMAATSGRRPEVDLIDDGWTHLTRFLTFTGEANTGEGASAGYERAEIEDFRVMEMIRGRISTLVEDPDTAERLKPYFRFFCKRPGFSDGYVEAFNRSNVTLVDTEGHGPERITEDSIIFRGVEYKVDGLVFCTGYDTGNGYLHGKGYDVTGRNGLKLTDYWADGMRTFQGIHSRNFPNCFFMGSTQTSITLNYAHCVYEQASQIVYVIAECNARGIRTVEVTKDAEAEWVKYIRDGWTEDRTRFSLECTPSFFNSEGKPWDPNGHIYNYVVSDPLAFYESLHAWRAEGRMNGLEAARRI